MRATHDHHVHHKAHNPAEEGVNNRVGYPRGGRRGIPGWYIPGFLPKNGGKNSPHSPIFSQRTEARTVHILPVLPKERRSEQPTFSLFYPKRRGQNSFHSPCFTQRREARTAHILYFSQREEARTAHILSNSPKEERLEQPTFSLILPKTGDRTRLGVYLPHTRRRIARASLCTSHTSVCTGHASHGVYLSVYQACLPWCVPGNTSLPWCVPGYTSLPGCVYLSV